MKLVRLSIRLPLFVLATAGFFGIWLAGKGATSFSPSARGRWRRFLFPKMGRVLAAAMGMRVRVQGEPPRPPFFLVANHLSYIDIIALGAVVDCVFISRHDVADWPFIGWLARSAGTIFLNRESMQDIPRVIGRIDGALDAGLGVVLFPEGTSTMGDQVLRFSPALLEPAARAGYPVRYATIGYRTPPGDAPAPLSVCWWGGMTFLRHLLGVLRLRHFEAHLHFGEVPVEARDRKELAKRLWTAVNAQFVPLVEPADVERFRALEERARM